MAYLQIDFYSALLGRSVQADVVLPETDAPDTGFPTLYLLHGLSDDHSNWHRFTSIERYAEERSVAVVMPTTRLGFYTNTYIGERYFDYISDELVRAMRRMLPALSQRRQDTFVAGLSMGGYGALKCALKRPDTFSKAASLSGALDPGLLVTDPMPLGRPFCWEDVFGPAEEIPGSENDLFHAAELLTENRPEIWMWCGTEDTLLPMSLRMRDHLRKLGYNLHFASSPGGHFWKCWDREIRNVIDWMVPGKGDEACL